RDGSVCSLADGGLQLDFRCLVHGRNIINRTVARIPAPHSNPIVVPGTFFPWVYGRPVQLPRIDWSQPDGWSADPPARDDWSGRPDHPLAATAVSYGHAGGQSPGRGQPGGQRDGAG